MKIFWGAIFALWCSLSAFAASSLEEQVRALQDTARDYGIEGTVCEEVARLQLERDYPHPAFDVVTGIAYGNGGRTVGELDVIVFDHQAKHVVKVGEVKCWKDIGGGLRKAKEQRKRFLATMQSGRKSNLHFESTTDRARFDPAQFLGVRDFITIAQKGSESAGYDIELEYSLDELMTLRKMMMACQKSGECKRH